MDVNILYLDIYLILFKYIYMYNIFEMKKKLLKLKLKDFLLFKKIVRKESTIHILIFFV